MIPTTNGKMSKKTIPIWEHNVPGYESAVPGHLPVLEPYLLEDGQSHPAVIVFPGGGYQMKAAHEAEPVATWLNSIGLSAFVLDYRVFPYRHPYPMIDGQRAVKFVRANADNLRVKPDQIGVLGFSAGGHLASTIGTHITYGSPSNEDRVDDFSSRPDALILCYPVITFLANRHIGSMESLLGANPPEDSRQLLSNELQVTKETPQSFLFHTANDSSVPVENSLLFAQALSKNNIPFELHVFPDGEHGVGLAASDPYLGIWTHLCESWFKKIGFLPS